MQVEAQLRVTADRLWCLPWFHERIEAAMVTNLHNKTLSRTPYPGHLLSEWNYLLPAPAKGLLSTFVRYLQMQQSRRFVDTFCHFIRRQAAQDRVLLAFIQHIPARCDAPYPQPGRYLITLHTKQHAIAAVLQHDHAQLKGCTYRGLLPWLHQA